MEALMLAQMQMLILYKKTSYLELIQDYSVIECFLNCSNRRAVVKRC
jgi:hypothetical protein